MQVMLKDVVMQVMLKDFVNVFLVIYKKGKEAAILNSIILSIH